MQDPASPRAHVSAVFLDKTVLWRHVRHHWIDLDEICSQHGIRWEIQRSTGWSVPMLAQQSMKHDTLVDRVGTGSAVNFHLPTSLPKTDHPEIFEFHSEYFFVNRSRRDLSNHAPHVAGDVLDLVDNFDPRFPCSVPAQKLALSCRGSDSPVPGKASFPPHSDRMLDLPGAVGLLAHSSPFLVSY